MLYLSVDLGDSDLEIQVLLSILKIMALVTSL